ncbi:MAG TPA: flagellar motor protein MotB, partial [Massilibacterium sp.]|nr:flagellar motor protein MotB [Massilibacterium sp.]
MARKRKKKDDHMDESWLLPYSDLLTLLLALFIVLFSMSNVDAKKFAEFSSSFSSALSGGTGVMDNPSPVEVENPKTVGTKDTATDAKTKEEAQAAKKAVKEKRDLQEM